MFASIKRALWGDVSKAEFKQFGLLSLAFFFIVGSYWMLRELKNAWFMELVGPSGLPYAKMVSIASLICLLIFYNKLVDWLEKTQLLYALSIAYGAVFLTIATMLAMPGVHGSQLGVVLGWVLYVVIESFGSLVVASFWSYVSSVTETSQAKRCYPLVVSGAQLGSMLGSVVNMCAAHSLGGTGLFGLAGASVFFVPVLIYLFHKNHGVHKQEQTAQRKKNTGVLEGLKLLLSKPYLMGIFFVSTVYEVISTMFDFLMNSSAKESLGSLEKVIQFQGMYGLATNGVSFLFALLGTSLLIRKLGLTTCLIAFPTMIAVLVLAVWQWPSLWMFLAAQVALKGISYALNNPCKEIMYIPTSKDVKFKAKSWIDVQGSRSAKAIGSTINATFPIVSQLIYFGSFISLGIIAIWIPIAYYVGRKNNHLVDSKTIIE